MSDILGGYRTFLLASTGVQSLVSGRVYHGNLPQSATYPSIVLHVITSETQRHLTDAAGLARTTLQVDVFGRTHTSAEGLQEQVRLATEHYTGMWGAETIRNAMVVGATDLTEPPRDGSQVFNHIKSLDVVAWHTQALST